MTSSARASRLATRLAVLPRAAGQLLATTGRRKRPTQPRSILVAHSLLLGDTLMLTPLLAKLRAQYPEADIAMTVAPAFAGLYAARPYGVRIIPFNPHRSETADALLHGDGFDLSIVPGDNRYAWLALAAGARWIVAFAGDRPLHKNLAVDELIKYPNAPAAWGDMVAALVKGPPPAPYRVADWPAPPHEPFTRPSGEYCVLHVGASTALKLWEPAKWRSLAERLTARGLEVVWSGGKGEERLVDAVDIERRFRSYAGTLDLPQLWALLAGARLFVSPDTGVAHLGRIAGSPTVALFGPGSAVLCGAGDFWRASPYRAMTIDPFACRDQHTLFKREIDWVRRCQRSLGECSAPRCMQAIDVAMVERAIDELLS